MLRDLERIRSPSHRRGRITLGTPILLVALGDGQAVHAWDRNLEGETLNFTMIDGGENVIRDRNSGSAWSGETGVALEGPYAGKNLRRIEAMPIYWAIWARFHPDTAVVSVK